MKEVWLVEHRTEHGWQPARGRTPMTKKEAEQEAANGRFDLVGRYIRIAKYVRHEESK